MLKGILLGLVIGGVATAGVLKALESKNRAPAPEQKPEGEAARAADPGALRADLDRVLEANEALRKQIAGREGSIAAAAKDEKDGKSKKKSKSWKDIAPALIKFFKNPEEANKDQKAAQAVWMDLLAVMGAIAKEKGVSLEEVMMAPEGLPALLMAVLDASETPLSPEQRAQMEMLMAQASDEWKRFQADKSVLSTLEQRLRLMSMSGEVNKSFDGVLTDPQRDLTKSMAMVGMMGSAMGGGMSYSSGTREHVAEDLTKSWMKALKLDESQAPAVKPIVEEYMRAYEEAQKSMASGGFDPGEFDYSEVQKNQLQAQIEAQKRLGSSLSLTEEQRKALKDWRVSYSFFVHDQASQPQPVEPAPEDK